MFESYIDAFYNNPILIIYLLGCLVSAIIIKNETRNRKLDSEDYLWFPTFTAFSWIFVISCIFMKIEENS